MPPAAKFDLTFLLLDLKTDYMDFLLNFYGMKCFEENNDLVKIFAIKKDSQVAELTEVEFYKPEHVKIVENFDSSDSSFSNETDWLNAVDMCLQKMGDYLSTAKGVTGRRIILVSDLKQELNVENSYDIEKRIVDNLWSYEVYFFIVGPNIDQSASFPNIETFDDIKQFNDTIQLEDANPTSGKIAKSIIKNISDRCSFADFETALSIVDFFKDGKDPQAWYCNMTVGKTNNISIPVAVYRFTIDESNPSFKAEGETKENKYYNLQTEEEVDFEDTVNVYNIHHEIIPYTNDEDTYWKTDSFKSFEILGFGKNFEQIQLYFYGDSNGKVFPDHRQEENAMFYTLYEVMLEDNWYAVVSRVYYNNSDNNLYVMFPEKQQKNFLLAAIPTKEEVEFSYLPEITKVKEDTGENHQKKEIDDYLSNLYEKPLLHNHLQRNEMLDLLKKNLIEISLQKPITPSPLELKKPDEDEDEGYEDYSSNNY